MSWIIWSLAALVGWGMWAALNKRALRSVGWEHLLIASWLAYTAALILILIFRVDPRPLVSRDGAIALAAAISAVIAEATFFLALRSGPAATVTPLSSLYPAVTVVLAVALLRESPSALQWAGVGVAVLAGFLLTRP